MRFTEAEMTAAITGVAKAALTAQSKDIRKGRLDVERAWTDLGGLGRYQLMEGLGEQVLPILVALPDVPRTVGERPSYSAGQIRELVEETTGDEGGKLRRKAVVIARVALVQAALAAIPPWTDPDDFVVPDSLGS